MTYFQCLVESSKGLGVPLVVTCTSYFAGLEITCTDGNTVFTDICPSSAPYEVTFNILNTGTWSVSGTIDGITYTEDVLVENFEVSLVNRLNITVDFYSAVNDTVSYTGAVDGQTHTIITDGNGHATATIEIYGFGSEITFTSSIAKRPDSLSDYYSKQVELTDETTVVYCMPDNFLYWYGTFNKSEEFDVGDCKTNGYVNGIESYTIRNMTYNTNSARSSYSDETANTGGIATNVLVDLSKYDALKCIVYKWENAESGKFAGTFLNTTKKIIRDVYFNFTGTVMVNRNISNQTGTRYVGIQCNWRGNFTVYALWLE